MEKFYILLITLSMVFSACNRSQFSTTSRHYKNGKIVYINQYHSERSKFSKVKSLKGYLKETDTQNNSPASAGKNLENLYETGITKIKPARIPDDKNLIASNSNEPTIIALNKNQKFLIDDLILSLKKHKGVKTSNSNPDTTKNTAPKKGTTNDSITQTVIKYKNGQKETIRIIYQSHDTLKYQLISETNIMRTIMMEKVDSILQVKSIPGQGKVIDTRKTEKLGLVGFILSIPGLFPVFGLPFAILAVIFGARSIRKINRYPERFKGKENAHASLILGIIGILMPFIILIVLAISGFSGI